MKRFFLTFILALVMLSVNAQSENVTVKMKNGISIIGRLIRMDVTKEIVVQVGGQNQTIPMTQVESVENSADNNGGQTSNLSVKAKLQYGKYEITDHADYPDSIDIDIEGTTMTLYLVRGGKFVMGYDGRHSWAMKTEPLHEVTLSSFYISRNLLSNGLVNRLTNEKTKNPNGPYTFESWSAASDVINEISKVVGLKLRFPTEAEWEYASLMPFASKIFASDGTKGIYEYCSDYFSEYTEEPQLNPTGPLQKTKYGHVIRSFFMGHNKWQRNYVKNIGVTGMYDGYTIFPCVRLVLSAKDYKK